MSDENDVRRQDRAREEAVLKRVSDVIGDLIAGDVPRTARRDLGYALRRADGAADVQRAIRSTPLSLAYADIISVVNGMRRSRGLE